MNDRTARESPHDTGLGKNAANYVPLTPIGFLARAAAVYPERTACIHGARRISYADLYARCRRLASALHARGVGRGPLPAALVRP